MQVCPQCGNSLQEGAESCECGWAAEQVSEPTQTSPPDPAGDSDRAEPESTIEEDSEEDELFEDEEEEAEEEEIPDGFESIPDGPLEEVSFEEERKTSPRSAPPPTTSPLRIAALIAVLILAVAGLAALIHFLLAG